MKKRQKKKDKHPLEYDNFKKTLIITIVLSVISAIIGITIQLIGQSSVNACSYLDPITIDILAFVAALFLIFEGFFRLYEHPSATVKKQFTRIIRVVAGFMILALHIMQFIHK